MMLPERRIFSVFLSLCLCLSFSNASAQSQGNVIINTDPQGALVKLSGELSLSGVTPLKLNRSLSGRYKIEAIRDGFEQYRSTAYFSETQESRIDIKLTSKTKTKAFFRSLIIPGWGQKYYGSSTKSTFFTLGTVASAIAYFFVKDDYDSKVDIYTMRKAARDTVTRWIDIPRLDAELYDAQNEANDAEDRVNIMVGVTVGFYVFNLLDSFLMFPEYDTFTEYKALTVKPEIEGEKVGLSLSLRF
jgi:hypothetical protein